MQSGELIVTGTDFATIPLEKYPADVHVKFKGGLNIVPCNPHHEDSLQYEVRIGAQGSLELLIRWSVTGVREVTWHVYY